MYFTCNSEIKALKNLLNMEMQWIQGLPALLFDDLEKTLKKLVWKHLKFYTMIHYILFSTTHNIFKMKCQNNSLKYAKEFK